MSGTTRVETKTDRGKSIVRETGPQREKNAGGREALMGKKMGGGKSDLSHSFSGSKVKHV